MADDFVVDVNQIGTYPRVVATGPGDLILVQQGGIGGAYVGIAVSDFLATAWQTEGFLPLAPDGTGGIEFNGARFSFVGDQFMFSAGINAPAATLGAVTAQSVVAGAMTVGGSPVINLVSLDAALAKFALQSVWSINGRSGRVILTPDDITKAGGAPILNPHFGGWVTTPTPWNNQSNDDTVATTAWVQSWGRCSGAIVSSYNGRAGDVVPIADDVTVALTVPGQWGLANTAPPGDVSKKIANTAFVDDAISYVEDWVTNQFITNQELLADQYAPLNSPNFIGIPTAPTANPGTTTGQLATTAFVQAAVTASTTGVSSFNTRTGAVTLTTADITGAGGAALNSPVFTGTPTAPTPTAGDNSAKLATTAFVETALAAIAAGVTSFNTRTGAVTLALADVTAVGGAPTVSPALTGTPTAPTAAPGNSTTQIATTAFVAAALASLPASVSTFNGRSGAVTLLGADVSAAGGALNASPAFTGTPTAPTAAPGTANTVLATTAFVAAALAAMGAGVTSFNTRSGAVTLNASDLSGAGGALLASPVFSGIPSGPTAAPGTSTTQFATTAFVAAALTAAIAVTSFNTRTGAITLNSGDVSAAGGALLASPAFTGTPTAPTQVPGNNTTALATTAFVTAAMASAGGVASFNGRAGAVTLSNADVIGVTGGVLFTLGASPPTGVPGTNNQSLWWDTVGHQLYVNNGGVWALASTFSAGPQATPDNCRLQLSSATLLNFVPFRGGQIQINGAIVSIPNAGVQCTNAGVAANTLYYVYLRYSAGTFTLFVSTTGPANDTTAGNFGVRILTGDPTATMVGMVYSNASAQFQDDATWRGVASWFNRRMRQITVNCGNPPATSSTTTVILGTTVATFLTWNDEGLEGYLECQPSSPSSAVTFMFGLCYDAAANGFGTVQYVATATMVPGFAGGWGSLPEGGHTFAPIGRVIAGSGSCGISNAVIVGAVRI